MKCLALESKPGKQDTDSKLVRKLSFCPFCLYHGSNNLSYMNHVVIVHYNAAYGCGKCMKAVLLMGQQLKSHLKTCAGISKDDTASSSDREPALPATRESPCHVSKHAKDAKSNSAKESSSHKERKKSQKKSKDRDDASAKDKRDKDQSLISPARNKPLSSMCQGRLYARLIQCLPAFEICTAS